MAPPKATADRSLALRPLSPTCKCKTPWPRTSACGARTTRSPTPLHPPTQLVETPEATSAGDPAESDRSHPNAGRWGQFGSRCARECGRTVRGLLRVRSAVGPAWLAHGAASNHRRRPNTARLQCRPLRSGGERGRSGDCPAPGVHARSGRRATPDAIGAGGPLDRTARRSGKGTGSGTSDLLPRLRASRWLQPATGAGPGGDLPRLAERSFCADAQRSALVPWTPWRGGWIDSAGCSRIGSISRFLTRNPLRSPSWPPP